MDKRLIAGLITAVLFIPALRLPGALGMLCIVGFGIAFCATLFLIVAERISSVSRAEMLDVPSEQEMQRLRAAELEKIAAEKARAQASFAALVPKNPPAVQTPPLAPAPVATAPLAPTPPMPAAPKPIVAKPTTGRAVFDLGEDVPPHKS